MTNFILRLPPKKNKRISSYLSEADDITIGENSKEDVMQDTNYARHYWNQAK